MNWYHFLKRAEEAVPEEDLGLMRDFNGIPVNVENPAGTERVGVDGDGHEWRIKMLYDYGFVASSEGTDGDALDVYLGPDFEAENVYIVHQKDPDTGEYDEDKCMLGFRDARQAQEVFMKHYDSPDYFGEMTEVPFEEFKKIVTNKDDSIVDWADIGRSVGDDELV